MFIYLQFIEVEGNIKLQKLLKITTNKKTGTYENAGS